MAVCTLLTDFGAADYYVGAVKANMIGIIAEKREKQDTGWFRRFFRKAA